jgi:penicillin amidase
MLLKKFFIVFLTGTFLMLPAIWFGGRWILSFSVADYDGNIELFGASDKIEITFDAKAIPQIWARNNRDLYFALGWLHASERLFQMELIRRLTAGKLSEIFGTVALPVDIFQRKIGFVRKARMDFDALEPQTLSYLKSYCSGINAWINYKKILPPEFFILKLSPRQWKPIDCLSIALYQTWYAHSLMNKDIQYNQLIEEFGDQIEPLLVKVKDWSPSVVQNDAIDSFWKNYFFPMSMTFGSNSFVISPQKSASGKAIHACDPHLIINQIPGFWYIVGLHSEEGVNNIGVTVPGLPFVAMGHSDKIAYGFTVASVDLVDYYREKRNPQDSLQVLTPSGYQPMEVIKEEIKVKGLDQPKVQTIYRTTNGVVVKSDDSTVVSLKWAGFDFNAADILNTAFKLPLVDNFEDFKNTVTKFGALDVNWTYSDVNGNVGYQLGSPIPVRYYTDTFKRLAGENQLYQWHGYHIQQETPSVLNPKKGWIASCNNQIVSENWPYRIPGFYDPYRIIRASELLDQNIKISKTDLDKIQLDWVSVAALRWKDLMKAGAEKLDMEVLASTIDNWNGVMFEHGKIPAIFAFWWEYLSYPLFNDVLGSNWRLGQLIQEEVLTNNVEQIIDNLDTPGVIETQNDISAIALDSALANLNNRMYAQVAKLKLSHPLSRAKLVDYWLNLNRGPYDMGGDFSTLNANITVYEPTKKQLNTLVGPSMRFVLDWAKVDSFTIILNLGQSGNPFSAHYDDFLNLWKDGETWIVPFSRKKVYESKQNLLRIFPPNYK